MVFPDYYFFAERRLINHTIETRKVKNFDDCELLCYLNDSCVSLNFKKDPDNNEAVHICELNNATHLKYDSDLTTDAKFYYRGSKVSYKSIFLKLSPWNNIETIMNVLQIFVYSIIRFLSFGIYPFIFLSSFNFFLPQNACDKSSQCQNNATCQSGFTLKGYRCLCPPGFEGELCETGISLSQHFKWRICEILSDFQCWYDNCPSLSWWKWRKFVPLYIVLNLLKRKFFIIVYWARVLFSSLARFYIFVLLCFDLSACLLFCRMLYIVISRRAQK